MKSVIERLDDIENTARSIVAKAEEDKSQVEQEIQNPGRRKAAGR